MRLIATNQPGRTIVSGIILPDTPTGATGWNVYVGHPYGDGMHLDPVRPSRLRRTLTRLKHLVGHGPPGPTSTP